jgi:hypothetical protein
VYAFAHGRRAGGGARGMGLANDTNGSLGFPYIYVRNEEDMEIGFGRAMYACAHGEARNFLRFAGVTVWRGRVTRGLGGGDASCWACHVGQLVTQVYCPS